MSRKEPEKAVAASTFASAAGGSVQTAEVLEEVSQEALVARLSGSFSMVQHDLLRGSQDTADFSVGDFGTKTSLTAPAELCKVTHVSGVNRLKEGRL
ncbi:hypothetical protein CCYS_06590 [Corynebacterium cystitidis DSM 20524]|uniref:Uncharacterized protein n=1 Tax=Corynebacterium cystitidis DSM 20524 TaxID=1121357 RepID=A0A1H9S7V4_9CORY|nr:hypothetical protein CCYS_06590 [Corynebacterium cystitidis DSM 20524]SER81102.1 hypothetical protein SAMN05661109_01093 [Corynebacterium cystitidis DSM 20524]SNV77303.1 Uncharacterised protein [Corynebacterium cystitidis]